MKAQRGAGFGIVSYVVMAVVLVLILVGGLLLVNVVTSSESAAPTPAPTPSSLVECADSTWFDSATGSCVPRTVCEPGQQYDEETNTCAAALPKVESIAPTSGRSTGGTEVRVAGTGFEPGASLLIDGIEATDATVVNGTTITATTPGSGNLYPVDVAVVNPGADPVVLDNAFTYVAPVVKQITAINPDRGSSEGGEAVIIKGVGFREGIVVSFYGRPATDITVLDDSTLRVTTPAGPIGPVGVNVRNPGEAPYTDENGFRYVDQPPRVVTGVSPVKGPAAGGTKVTIRGSGFAGGASVTFGGRPAAKVTVVSSTRITAVTPTGRLGSVPVGVRNPGLPAALLDDAFTYVAAPTITSVKPAKGPIDGGTKVTITGTGFGPDAVVGVGNVVIEDAKVVDESTITLVMPPAAEPIKVDISVTNPGEPRALAKRAFTYTAAEPTLEPTPEPTPTPSATRPTTLPRCATFRVPTVTTSPGSGLVLGAAELFPSSQGLSQPTLVDAGLSDGAGGIQWQEQPPRIVWQAPSGGASSATITYAYQSASCRGFGTGVVPVAAR